MKPTVIFIATYDTKGTESEFIKQKIISCGADCITIDVGVKNAPEKSADISLEDLCSGTRFSAEAIRSMKRGEAVQCVSTLLEFYVGNLYRKGGMDALIGIGGAGGTQIVTQAMRTLPFGLPKLMLSTLASGNTRWYIQESDITMVPSIADVAGINCVTELVFERFAFLAAGAAAWHRDHIAEHELKMTGKKAGRIAQTMYGTTTEGVSRARSTLEKAGYETIVFHASGAGGRSMEQFIRDGVIHGVLDMTIAEIGAHLTGGLHDAGPDRMEAAVSMKIPLVVVPGAADTVVLPPMSALPEKFREGRILNFHNPTMTTMRTNVEECVEIGNFLVKKLRGAQSPVKILIPKGGLSSIDRPGEIFYLPEANEALFETLKTGFRGSGVEVIEDSRHLYDEGFGEDAAMLLIDLMKQQTREC